MCVSQERIPKSEYYNNMFRDNLREQIEYKGLIVKELAALSGVSKRTIDTYLDSRGVIPNAEIAVKLAKALDTTVEYLVTKETGKKKAEALPPEFALFSKYRDVVSDIERLSPELQTSIRAMIHTAARLSH